MPPRRLLGIAGGLLAVSLGAAWITLPAAEPPAPRAPGPTLIAPLPDADTIKDDPTVAPDPHESADNNISLPADI